MAKDVANRTSAKMFLSYSHEDRRFRKRLDAHLAILKKQGYIVTWDDREIPAGGEWDEIIRESLKSADVILLLISADFIASKYCWDTELKLAMERHDDNEALVIPVFCQPCHWSGAPFEILQGLPAGAKPISEYHPQARAYADVVEGIRAAIDRRRGQQRLGDPDVNSIGTASVTDSQGAGDSGRRDATSSAGGFGKRQGSTRDPAKKFAKSVKTHLEEGRVPEAAMLVEKARGWLAPQTEASLREKVADAAMENGDGFMARSHLWRLTELVVRNEVKKSLPRVENKVRQTVFHTDSRVWAASAMEYHEFVRKYPTCMQVRLCEYIALQLHASLLREDLQAVLDVCCGTGLLARVLDALRLPLRVVGYDIPEMLRIGENDWDHRPVGNHAGHEFHDIGELSQMVTKARAERFGAAVMNMAVFQFGLRERLLLLRDVSNLLRDNASFWVSTHAPDFEFPENKLNPDDKLNSVNPFKYDLYRVWNEVKFYPERNANEAATPVFKKDTVDTIRHLLNVCGLDLITSETSLPVIELRRTIDERIAFTRIAAISHKVFGRSLESKWWEEARNRLQSQPEDMTYGTVLLACKTGSPVPYVFFETPAPPQTANQGILFRMAAVLRRDDGRTLFVKRGKLGPLVRDFPQTWSLPSSRARSGQPLLKPLRASLRKNLGVDVGGLKPLAVRVSMRGQENLFVMTLFHGQVGRGVNTRTKKYDELKWLSHEEALKEKGGCHGLGQCVTCYQDVIRRGWT